MKIPEHVAIILDGNGRWAKSKGLPRNAGHTAGAKNVETICEAAHDMGIKYLTLYAFSTENWNRPETEVNALMNLLESYLKNCIRTADKNNMRVRVIGEIGRLSEKFQDRIKELEKASETNTGLNLTIAINYGSRDEMIRAMKHMMEDNNAGLLSIEDVTAERFSSYLDTKDLPDPDLMIRTSDGSWTDYIGCEAMYVCKEDQSIYALYADQTLKYTAEGQTHTGTYKIKNDVIEITVGNQTSN